MQIVNDLEFITNPLIDSPDNEESKIVMKCELDDDIMEQRVYNKSNVVSLTTDKAFRRCTLKHVDVELVDNNHLNNIQVSALIDSGTEFPVVSRQLLEGMETQETGSINIQGVTGEPVAAKVIILYMRLLAQNNEVGYNENIGNCVPIMCAVVESLGNNEKLLLHPEIISELETNTQQLMNPVIINALTRAQAQGLKEEVKATMETKEEEEKKEDIGRAK